MNNTQLRTTFTAQSGVLTLPRATLTGGVREFWDIHYPSSPLELRDAAPGPDDGVDGVVVVRGRASLLGAADLPVLARFWLADDGSVEMELRYQLRDLTPTPSAWTFRRSFPDLPSVWNHATPVSGEVDAPAVLAAQTPYVESLYLFDTHFVLASSASDELVPGLNLVSQMQPQGALGMLEASFGAAAPLTLRGPLRIPTATDMPAPLVPYERPWDRDDPPGISLRAALGVGFSLGGLEFRDSALQIYTPHARAWLGENPTFEPRIACTGTIAIASAGITLAAVAEFEWNYPQVNLRARCDGVTLGGLSQLTGLAGGSDLASGLPDEISQLMAPLGHLALTELGCIIQAGTGALALDQLLVTVGLPGVAWNIWGDLQVRDLAVRFVVSTPTTAASVAIDVMGTLELDGVALRVVASSGDNYCLYAFLEDGVTIPLDRLVKRFAPGSFRPAPLTVDSLLLTLGAGRLEMSMRLAGDEPWALEVGKLRLSFEDLALDLAVSKGSPTTGAFAGVARIGDNFELGMRCTLAGDLDLRGVFRELRLSALVAMLCDELGASPPGFDLDIDTLTVVVARHGQTCMFSSAAAIEGLGTLAFVARKSAGVAGYAFGLAVEAETLAALPGLGPLAALEKFVTLQRFLVVASSFDDATFTFPELASFNQPALASRDVKLPGTGGVLAGFNINAAWAIDGGGREQKLLASLLGLSGTLDVTIQVGTKPGNARMYLGGRGEIHRWPFEYKLGVVLADGKPGFFLTGRMTVTIQKQPQIFDVTTVLAPGGAFLSANMTGAAAIQCGPIALSQLGLVIGVNWGGIPSLGISAAIAARNFHSSVAIFFDSTDPSKSLVAGSLSDTTLRDVAAVLVGDATRGPIDDILARIGVRGTQRFEVPGDLADELDNLEFAPIAAAFAAAAKITIPADASLLTVVPLKKARSWHLTDRLTMRHYSLERAGQAIAVTIAPQFYFAPQATALGTVRFPQGYYVNAAIDILGFTASATIEVSIYRGISIEATMDPITVGDGRLYRISSADGKTGPALSIASFTQPNHPIEAFRPPHCFIDGGITLLGVTSAVRASVTTRGIELTLSGPLAPMTTFDIDARLGKGGFAGAGQIVVSVGSFDLGPLGKVKLDTRVECGVEIDIDAADATVVVDADFVFMGEPLAIPEFELAVTSDALAKISRTIADRVEARLRDEFKSADRWARALASGALDGVDDAEKVLQDSFGKSQAAAKATLKAANDAARSAEKTVKKTTKKLKRALKKLF